MASVRDGEDDAWPLLQRLLIPVLRGLLFSVWRLQVSGLENIPRQGAVILACNHVSNADPPLVGCAAYPVRSLRYLAKVELFRVPVLGWLLRRGGAIALDRGRADVAAVRASLEVLSRGRCLLLFPEGTRSKSGRPGRPKSGVGFLSGKAGVPVIPTRVVNTRRFLRLSPLEVRFGKPLRFSGDPSDRGQCEAFSRLVMDVIFSL
ncbi:MAG TPA: 1-acyl-sn-glycerol-3-phosphate acyltransferase [Elusimicrobia bacterium]|nr:1-acyl-sn-glycerol-3-phosphate acyltransferase [Elusimicrobiota bacterium]HBT60784.1 1-acyl-sn-glycerol-3-phosphate acyltransferase [Elusimicrobiota bacterium]